jgi:hypothetical protein
MRFAPGGVLVQPENGERALSVSKYSALLGVDFQGIGAYRFDVDLGAVQESDPRAAVYRLVEPTRLSLSWLHPCIACFRCT